VITVYPETGKPLWVDMHDPSPEEIAQACDTYGLVIPPREQLEEIEFSSRLQYEDEVFTISVPVTPHKKNGEGEDETSPLGFVLTRDILVTVRFAHLHTFEAIQERVKRRRRSAPDIFMVIVEALVDYGADRLEELRAEALTISQRIFHKQMRRTQFTNVAGLEDAVKARLKMAGSDVQSLNDYEVHLTDKIQFLLDAALGFISTEQNDLFKVMTIWSIVGIPPVLFAGIWGMNFHFMPELGWPYGYPFALLTIIVSGLVPLGWFKWRGWW
jgi:magnesium transporter